MGKLALDAPLEFSGPNLEVVMKRSVSTFSLFFWLCLALRASGEDKPRVVELWPAKGSTVVGSVVGLLAWSGWSGRVVGFLVRSGRPRLGGCVYQVAPGVFRAGFDCLRNPSFRSQSRQCSVH